ncbi:MAG: hypothetical protein M5U34_26000 [Chloroflexi bacterium]|nr:hypothetical protein [Chloroflexota bacterium]
MKIVSYLIAAALAFLALFSWLAHKASLSVLALALSCSSPPVALSTWPCRPQQHANYRRAENRPQRRCGFRANPLPKLRRPLSEKSISVEAGAIFVNCEYCGASYQFEEKPKW